MRRALDCFLVGALACTLGCSSESTNEGSGATGGVASGGASGTGGATSGGGAPGGGASGGVGGSGGGGAPACDPNAAFGGITEVTELNHGAPNGDQFARLTQDETVVYFMTFKASWDLVSASRSANTGAFGSIGSLGLDSTKSDVAPTVTKADTALYFSSDRSGWNAIYVATRASPAVAFTLKTTPVIDGGSAQPYLNPYVLPDGSALYFVGGVGGTTFDLYRAESSGGVFGTPAKLQNVNSPNDSDGSPVVTADDKTLFFASQRGGDTTQEIYVSVRNDPKTEPFGTPQKVSELSRPDTDDIPSWISADGCRIYFFRWDTSVVSRIYRAARGG